MGNSSFIFLVAYSGKMLEFLSSPGFFQPWLRTAAEFLCWSQVNVLQSGAGSNPVDSCKLQFIYTILISGDIFALLPFPAQIIGLCQNKFEVFLSGVVRVDFDLLSPQTLWSSCLTGTFGIIAINKTDCLARDFTSNQISGTLVHS